MDGRFQKTQRKKVNGKGGVPPPPYRTFSVTGVFKPFPYTQEIYPRQNILHLPVFGLNVEVFEVKVPPKMAIVNTEFPF